MKKLLFALVFAMASVSMTTSVQANWFGSGNNGEWKMGPNGPYWDESDWPEWTPMYWMEEFMDSWDDNNNNWNYGGNYGGYGNNYGAPYGGYNMNPYGNMPYGYMPPAGGYAYPVPPAPTPIVPSMPAQ